MPGRSTAHASCEFRELILYCRAPSCGRRAVRLSVVSVRFIVEPRCVAWRLACGVRSVRAVRSVRGPQWDFRWCSPSH